MTKKCIAVRKNTHIKAKITLKIPSFIIGSLSSINWINLIYNSSHCSTFSLILCSFPKQAPPTCLKCTFSLSRFLSHFPPMARPLLHINGKPNVLSLSKANPHPPSLPYSYRPRMVTMSHNHSYWATIEDDIAAHLKRAIPVRSPVVVFEPMRHLVLSAPTNTAPALCIAACELVGGSRDQAIVAASALHLMHAAAFTHEHLPLTNNGPGSRPTINHAFKPNIELLTGDGIVPFGYELLARSVNPTGDNSGRILQVIIEITRAMGSQGMVDGQYVENECNQSYGNEESDRWMNYVCKKKEGELHACGAASGAILGGGSEEEREKLRRYGLYVGMIQGMLNGVGRNKKGLMEEVERLRNLALKELQGFNETKVETISSLVEANFNFSYV